MQCQRYPHKSLFLGYESANVTVTGPWCLPLLLLLLLNAQAAMPHCVQSVLPSLPAVPRLTVVPRLTPKPLRATCTSVNSQQTTTSASSTSRGRSVAVGENLVTRCRGIRIQEKQVRLRPILLAILRKYQK